MEAFEPTTETALATKTDIDSEIAKKASSGSLLINCKIVQKSSKQIDEKDANGDPVYRPGDLTIFGGGNLGQSVEAVISIWRYHALRFKNMDEVDAEDFNLSEGATFNWSENSWTLPGGMTPGYREILQKTVPDCGAKPGPQISNCAGYDILLWLPGIQEFVTFLLARTALTMTDTYDICRANRGRCCTFGSQMLKSKKFSWYGPKIELYTQDKELPMPKEDEAEEIIDKFLNPGIISEPGEETSRPR